MTIQEFASRPSPEGGARERLSDKRSGNLVAAVGNSESKALLFSSMRYGSIYFQDDLGRLMKEGQGTYNVWQIDNRALFYSYCGTSFARAGLVTVGLRNPDLTSWGYEKTSRGQKVGDAIIGHLLEYSEKHPNISLIALFGITSSMAELRIKIFHELLASRLPIKQVDLVRILGESEGRIRQHLDRLSWDGVITYDSIRADQSFSYFRVSDRKPKKAPSPWAMRPTLTKEIYRLVSRRKGTFSADSVLGLLKNLHPQLSSDSLKDKVAGILNHLEKEGYLERQKFGHLYQSEINLNNEQRSALVELVSILEKFNSQDPDFLEQGRSKAFEITTNPRRFSALLLKAKEASPNANPSDPKETEKEILSIVFQHPDITTTEIQRCLRDSGKSLSKGHVATLVKSLRERGFIKVMNRKSGFHYGPIHQVVHI